MTLHCHQHRLQDSGALAELVALLGRDDVKGRSAGREWRAYQSDTLVKDGDKYVHVKDFPAGWEIAPGDLDDIRICGAHPWQSYYLVFANGRSYGTAMCDDKMYIGIIRSPSKNLNFPHA
jgi:hypothetical protein